jgi:TonB family protein
MLPAVLVVIALACGRDAVQGGGDQEKGVPSGSQDRTAKETKQEGKGHIVSVKGPCGDKPCCKPIAVTLPAKLEPKVFSPRMAMKLTVDPDGIVQKVKITKSSGIEDVDRQLREGASVWCMEKTKEGREIDFMVNLDMR